MNAYILMPWGMVEVKDVGPAAFSEKFANVRRGASGDYAAHVDTTKFPLVFAEAPPSIFAAPVNPQ